MGKIRRVPVDLEVDLQLITVYWLNESLPGLLDSVEIPRFEWDAFLQRLADDYGGGVQLSPIVLAFPA